MSVSRAGGACGKERSILASLAVAPRRRGAFNEKKCGASTSGRVTTVERLLAAGEIVEDDGVLTLTEAGRMRLNREQRRPLTERELEVLREVPDAAWVRPMDVGGRDASHHSNTLTRLASLGLVERQPRGTLSNYLLGFRKRYASSYEYRRTPAGKQALDERRQAPTAT